MTQETKTQVAARSGWHGSEASAVARELGVEPERGLSVEEARSRLQSHGPNRLTAAKKESGVQAFLRQYRDVMQLILLAAAVINLLVTGDVGTSVRDRRRVAAAPGRLSTTTDWPSDAESRSPTVRAKASAGPPGGKGTIRRTGLTG